MEKHKLPEDWEWERLGVVCKIVSGSTPRTDNPAFWNGDILWATPKDLGQLKTVEISDTERKITKAGHESCSTQLLPVGSVLLSSRAPIGHLAINAKPICTNQGFKSMIPGNRIFNRYLYWCLKFYVPMLQHAGRGGTFDEIPKRLVEPFEIPVPPLPEQKRIVTKIEQLASRAEKARKLNQQALEEAENFLSSAVATVFEDGITKGWKVNKVTDICQKPQYGYTESANFEPVGPKFLRITDIQDRKVDWDKVPYCVCDEVDKYRLQTGDILFTRTGATTGKSYLVKSPPEAVFASYLIRLKAGPKLLPEFLYWYFQSSLYWVAVTRGIDDGNRPNMNGTKLKNLTIPYPEDKLEQQRIVDYLDGLQERVDKLKQLQTEIETDLATFTPALLAKAFKGEL